MISRTCTEHVLRDYSSHLCPPVPVVTGWAWKVRAPKAARPPCSHLKGGRAHALVIMRCGHLKKSECGERLSPPPCSPLILLLLQTPTSIQRTRLPTPLVFHHVLEEMREENSARPQLITCLSVQRVKVVNGETKLGKNRELEMTDDREN